MIFAQIRMWLYGAAILAAVGLAGALWYQNGKIDRLKKSLDWERLNKEACLYANAEGVKTIAALRSEIAAAGATCERRVTGKDRLIAELRKIDATEGGTHEHRSEGGDVGLPSGNDPLLDLINGVLPGQGGRPDGVCEAAGPAGPGGAVLVPRPVRYCFCSERDVRNFAKDWALCRAWARDGVHIIEGLR